MRGGDQHRRQARRGPAHADRRDGDFHQYLHT